MSDPAPAAGIESRLPAALRDKASVYLGEWAWKTADLPAVLEAAACLRLAVVLGDPRISLPQGVYELSAPTTGDDDEDMQMAGESWGAFVERAAHEAREAVQRLIADRSWLDGEPYAPRDLADLEWVVYFITEPASVT